MRRCHTRRAQRHASRDGGHASELLQQLRSGLQSLLYHRCIDCRRFDDDDDLFDILYTSGPRRCGVDGNVHDLFIEHSIDLAFYDDNDSLFERLCSSSSSFFFVFFFLCILLVLLLLLLPPPLPPKNRDQMLLLFGLPEKKKKRNVISQRERPSRSRWFLFSFGQIWCILSILKCRQTASHSREEYITSSFNLFFILGRLWYVYKCTGWGGYRNRDKVYIRYLYTRNRTIMMTTTMTMLLTRYSVHMYLQTKCPKTETIWKIQVPSYPRYYLDLPDGQLMIGSKVVGTVEVGRTLSLSLITKGKKSFLDCLSFYLHGEDQIKKAGELREVINLSYRLTPVGTHRLSQTLTDSLTDSHSGLLRQAYLEPSAIVCVCVAFWLFPTNELIGKKVRSFLGGRVKVVLYYFYCITTPNFYLFYSFNFD